MKFTHLIFDLDGTLVDSVVEIHAAAAAICHQHGLKSPDLAYIKRMTGSPPRLFFEDHGCSSEDTESLVREFRQHLAEHAGHPDRVFAASKPLLVALNQQGVRTSVATTKPTQLAATLLQRYGLAELLQHIQGTDPPMQHKPHPDILLACIAQQPTAKAMMVGDTIFDVEAAHRAGIASVAVCSGAHSAEELAGAKPTHLAQTLQDLFDILELKP